MFYYYQILPRDPSPDSQLLKNNHEYLFAFINQKSNGIRALIMSQEHPKHQTHRTETTKKFIFI